MTTENETTNVSDELEVADPILDDWLHFNVGNIYCDECGTELMEGICYNCLRDRKHLAEVQFEGRVR